VVLRHGFTSCRNQLVDGGSGGYDHQGWSLAIRRSCRVTAITGGAG